MYVVCVREKFLLPLRIKQEVRRFAGCVYYTARSAKYIPAIQTEGKQTGSCYRHISRNPVIGFVCSRRACPRGEREYVPRL
jgi:hypothetical protein